MAYKGDLSNVGIIGGRSNPELSKKIAAALFGDKDKLVDCILDDFANGEIRVELLENIRGRDIFVIETGVSDNYHSINDYFVELLAITDACKRSNARTVTVIMPFYPYSRSDKKDNPRVPIMAKVVANALKKKIFRLISLDLHSGQIQGFGDFPFDNLFAINLFVDYFNKTLFNGLTHEEVNSRYVLVSPDNGGIKRIDAYAKRLKMPFVTMHKQRDYTQKSVVMKSMLIGDPESLVGKTAIMIDDMVDTMGTMQAASNTLRELGVKDVVIVATHGIFSGPAFKRIEDCDAIREVIVTNTLPQDENLQKSNKIRCVDTSGLFSEVIQRLVEDGSISDLFR